MSVLGKAIQAKCLDCCAGQIGEVRRCHIVKCALHPFRDGKDHSRAKRVLTPEQRAAAAERFAKMRAQHDKQANQEGLAATGDS